MNHDSKVIEPTEQDTEDAVDDSLHATLAALGCWRGDIAVSVLSGGITNRNYRVEDATGTYVVRLGDDIPVHHILRCNELAASAAAYAAGLAPGIHFHQPGVLVLDFISGTTLTPEDVRNPDKLMKIVDLVKRCHTTVPLHLRGATLVFWVFHVVRDYVATLRESDSPWKAHLDDWLDCLRRLEAEAGPHDIVFGHNDLLSANILDDGVRLWLIDWEYAGFNSPLFDLGGLASNNELPESSEHRLLEYYYGEPVSGQRWRQYNAMKCASLLRETMWSMVSEIHSTLDFDYAQYSKDNLKRFEQALQRFEHCDKGQLGLSQDSGTA